VKNKKAPRQSSGQEGDSKMAKRVKVGINGFGRIGRNVVRAALKSGANIEFVAVNDLTDAKTLAYLMQYDSVHGVLDQKVTAGEGEISIGGTKIKVLSERDPGKLPWKELGVEIVMECTGLFLDSSKAKAHLDAGAKKVILSAPGKGECKFIVMGVNDKEYNAATDNIVSNASCTTNCLAPMAKVLDEKFGIEAGLMTTVHSYTNDQKILDLPHKDLRRARAAAMSIIPTSTGAAKAVGKVLKNLDGKLNGIAMRVPTPDASVVDLVVNFKKETSVEEINKAIKAAAEGELKGILQYTEDPIVSTDIIGNPHSSVFDAKMTLAMGKNMFKVLSWYDNEMGFSNRMNDLAQLMGSKL